MKMLYYRISHLEPTVQRSAEPPAWVPIMERGLHYPGFGGMDVYRRLHMNISEDSRT
ncbi:hypothetical protein JXA40_03585 [bacterium]|nr:hypothetical protein [candidate division CSSED10-310 bacterium]